MIFEYTDPAKFLNDAWKLKKAKSPQLSLRSWASKIGFESHSSLHLLLTGKRTVPRKAIKNLAQALELTPKETHYFELLVEFQKAKTIEEKTYFAEKIRKASSTKTKINMFEVESFKYLSDPLHTVVLEMIDLKDFDPSPEWIVSRLNVKASVKDVRDVLARLIDFKLVEVMPDGSYRKTHQHLSSKHDQEDLGVRKYHQSTSEWAKEFVERLDCSEREFGSYTFNLKPGQLPLLKKMFRNFIKDIFASTEAAPGEGTVTFQVNLQAFPVTKINKTSEEVPQISMQNERGEFNEK